VKTLATHPKAAALVGSLFTLPFLILNAIVGNRVEPFFSLIRPGIHTSLLEYVLLFIVLLLIPTGAFIVLCPISRQGAAGARRFPLVNGVIAALLIVVFAFVSIGLALEIYRCDVLLIPNCD
jgi:hypothetical protein